MTPIALTPEQIMECRAAFMTMAERCHWNTDETNFVISGRNFVHREVRAHWSGFQDGWRLATAHLLSSLDNRKPEVSEGWQDIATAPKDGTFVIVRVGEMSNECWNYLNGRAFVSNHAGRTESGYDLGWNLFPGLGGVADFNLAGWAPLPASPQTAGEQ